MVSDQIKRAFGELFRQKTDIESLTIIRTLVCNNYEVVATRSR